MQFLKLGRLVLCVSLSTIGYAATEPFIRGDSDVDGVVTLNDAVFTLNYLFQGGSAPTCEDAADVNDDGQIGIDDPVYTLLFLFQGGIVPPSPFPCEDQDFTADRLECDAYNIPEGHLHIRGLRSPPLLLSPGLGDTVLRERLILSQDTLFTEARVYFRTAETPEQAISDASALIDVRLKIDDEIVGDTGVLIDAGVLGLIDPSDHFRFDLLDDIFPLFLTEGFHNVEVFVDVSKRARIAFFQLQICGQGFTALYGDTENPIPLTLRTGSTPGSVFQVVTVEEGPR